MPLTKFSSSALISEQGKTIPKERKRVNVSTQDNQLPFPKIKLCKTIRSCCNTISQAHSRVQTHKHCLVLNYGCTVSVDNIIIKYNVNPINGISKQNISGSDHYVSNFTATILLRTAPDDLLSEGCSERAGFLVNVSLTNRRSLTNRPLVTQVHWARVSLAILKKKPSTEEAL